MLYSGQQWIFLNVMSFVEKEGVALIYILIAGRAFSMLVHSDMNVV